MVERLGYRLYLHGMLPCFYEGSDFVSALVRFKCNAFGNVINVTNNENQFLTYSSYG